MNKLSGKVEIVDIKGISKVITLYSTYPYRYIQTNQNNSRFVCVYSLSFGGGCVTGDQGNFFWKVNENATICFFTQGTTKILKSINDNVIKHETVCEISNLGLLCYFPDSTALFTQSNFQQKYTFFLELTSSLIFVDWFSCGRQEMNEFWSLKRLRSRIEIYVEKECVFLENLDLKESELGGSIADKVGHTTVFGTILLIGPRTSEIRNHIDNLHYKRLTFDEHVEEVMKRRKIQDDNSLNKIEIEIEDKNIIQPSVSVTHLEYSVTSITDQQNFSVVRFTSNSTENGYKTLHKLLSPFESTVGFCPYENRLVSVM